MDPKTIIAAVFVFIFAYIMIRIFIAPFKWLARWIVHVVVGAIGLWMLDLVGRHIGLTIGINPITAVVAGTLGIPGVALLAGLKLLLG